MNSKQPSLSPSSESSENRLMQLFQSSATPTPQEEQWDLGWVGAVFRRRAKLIAAVMIGTVVAGGGLLFSIKSVTPAKYAGRFQLLVEPVNADQQQARSSAQAQGVENSLPPFDPSRSSLDYGTQIRILQSPRLMNGIVKELQTRYPDITYEKLLLNLELSRITSLTLDLKEQGTKIIDVSYQDSDPRKVQYVLDKISQAYLQYSLKDRQSTIRQGIKFIDSQLPQLQQQVNSLQGQIQDLRERNSIVDPELEAQQLSQQASNLGQQSSDSQTDLAEAQARTETLSQQLQSNNLTSVLGEAPYYQSLLNQYQEIAGEIATESGRLQPDNPAMQALLEKQQNLQSLMDIEAARVVSKAADSITVAEARDRAITQSEAEVNQEIQLIPAVARQYADLQRELELATESLNKFSSRQEALQIDAAQQEVPWELITPPQLIRDEDGNLEKVGAVNSAALLGLIAVLGILLGIGVGFLVEVSQDILQTPDETKRSTGLPLLGAVPLDKAKNAAFIESFYSIYKNIRLLPSFDPPARSLAISSPQPGDGKTTIAVNLAQAVAAMGKRVLLVDADLRHPQVHQLLNLPNTQGLSDIFSANVSLSNAIQPSAVRDNLMVLTAGQTVGDPLELLTSEKMRAMMEHFQTVFDLVIYDTPPLLGLADSGLIASQTDGLVLVARMGKSKRSALAQTLEELKISSTAVLGVVANAAKETANMPEGYYRARSLSQS
ncbi:MAG: polysaccharide biosynthesis tyrosine autokinase [Drouetiella hepatica Uher 2000/2452]|uniref:non-specific protein-tyrosine kinase n=1 Tax=Drouetiella hepatica Uher 2000/2452 TaxID=904376 RepID=A0A951UP12_9CYAN|nr:polysaccharide biosynthesis tyrosine autokinase [Drouetiella hepatica Uher 2000/2452]